MCNKIRNVHFRLSKSHLTPCKLFLYLVFDKDKIKIKISFSERGTKTGILIGYTPSTFHLLCGLILQLD